MCGITGVIDINNQLTLERRTSFVREMNKALIHRGPDEMGFFEDNFCSLAMRRLAIIDLTSGKQPLWNEDKSVCAFLNGEIYNYKEIKNDLIQNGHKFYTQSDTEILVHLFEEHRFSLPKFLKGMFTFCIYDVKEKLWFFSRDRFGEKPFYYHFKNNVFSFSSEIKSLLENNSIEQTLSHSALHYFLENAYIPEPLTLLSDIFTLKPGHNLILKDGDLQISSYFNINYDCDKKISDLDEAEELIRPVLEKAVKRQMVSDVPIAAFLSGGIDSSSICALMQKHSSESINTFNVKFEEQEYDESKIARKVAEKIGSNHHEIYIKNLDFTESDFWTILDHVGLPFPDSSAIPVYKITKEISKHVKVALSGDGGDEIFGGYPVFSWWKKINSTLRIPSFIRSSTSSLINKNWVPQALVSNDKQRKIFRALEAGKEGQDGISKNIHRMFLDNEIKNLYPSKNGSTEENLLTSFPKNYYNWTPLRKSMFYRLNQNLVTDMLVKVDRMSMANSLEVRAPFLDVDVFEASKYLDDNLLMKNNTGKIILRKIMKHSLPPEVFDHPKSGFSIPLHRQHNKDYHKLINENIHKSNPIAQLFEYSEITKLKNLVLNNQVDKKKSTLYRSSHQLWLLLQLFAWVKKYSISI
jgi:asparagine synthase (glutamine-hydrolysing)